MILPPPCWPDKCRLPGGRRPVRARSADLAERVDWVSTAGRIEARSGRRSPPRSVHRGWVGPGAAGAAIGACPGKGGAAGVAGFGSARSGGPSSLVLATKLVVSAVALVRPRSPSGRASLGATRERSERGGWPEQTRAGARSGRVSSGGAASVAARRPNVPGKRAKRQRIIGGESLDRGRGGGAATRPGAFESGVTRTRRWLGAGSVDVLAVSASGGGRRLLALVRRGWW